MADEINSNINEENETTSLNRLLELFSEIKDEISIIPTNISKISIVRCDPNYQTTTQLHAVSPVTCSYSFSSVENAKLYIIIREASQCSNGSTITYPTLYSSQNCFIFDGQNIIGLSGNSNVVFDGLENNLYTIHTSYQTPSSGLNVRITLHAYAIIYEK